MATKFEMVQSTLGKLKDKIGTLRKGDAERFIQFALNFIEGKEKILNANPNSLYAEILRAAQMGLMLDGSEASLVPFKESVKLMVGYKGILKLIRNSGEISTINCGVVYEKDEFDFWVDEKGEHLTHRPAKDKDKGKQTHSYCIARVKNADEPYIEVMTEDEIQACKKVSRAGEDSPWNGPFADEMRKKTVIRRISKRLPSSTDLQAVFQSEDETEVIDTTATVQQEEQTTSPRLENALGVTNEAEKQLKSSGAIKTFECFIEKIRGIKDVFDPNDGQKKTRYQMLVNDSVFGTWKEETYKKIETFYDKKVKVSVKYCVILSGDNNVNEIVEINQAVASSQVPI